MLGPDLGNTRMSFNDHNALRFNNMESPAEFIDSAFNNTSVRPAKRHKITSAHNVTPNKHLQPDRVNINAFPVVREVLATPIGANLPKEVSELSCGVSLYDNTDFRDLVLCDAYCLMRLLDPALRPWTLHQSLWDVRPSDGELPRSLTDGCAFVQLDSMKVLEDDDAFLTTRLLKSYDWTCSKCTARHTKLFSCTWIILLGAGLLTRAQWRGLNIGSHGGSCHLQCAYIFKGTFELFRSCGVRGCTEPGHLDALRAKECTERLGDGVGTQIFHTHPALLDPLVQRRLHATIYVSSPYIA
jgi:hypothetical protein